MFHFMKEGLEYESDSKEAKKLLQCGSKANDDEKYDNNGDGRNVATNHWITHFYLNGCYLLQLSTSRNTRFLFPSSKCFLLHFVSF